MNPRLRFNLILGYLGEPSFQVAWVVNLQSEPNSSHLEGWLS